MGLVVGFVEKIELILCLSEVGKFVLWLGFVCEFFLYGLFVLSL